MASAVCVSCQKIQRILGGRGCRVADQKCRQCGGPLKGASSREHREVQFSQNVDAHLIWLRGFAGGAPNHHLEHYVAIEWRTIANWAFRLWPALLPDEARVGRVERYAQRGGRW